MIAAGGSGPSKPITARAAAIGTTSAAVIQSRPSMKFTRLTNHRPPITSALRSTGNGRAGNTRNPGGSTKMTAATASVCTNRRHATFSG